MSYFSGSIIAKKPSNATLTTRPAISVLKKTSNVTGEYKSASRIPPIRTITWHVNAIRIQAIILSYFDFATNPTTSAAIIPGTNIDNPTNTVPILVHAKIISMPVPGSSNTDPKSKPKINTGLFPRFAKYVSKAPATPKVNILNNTFNPINTAKPIKNAFPISFPSMTSHHSLVIE